MERELDSSRDLVVVPGLVVGPGERGLFARLRTTVGRRGFAPIFDGGRQPVQTVHVEDLCRALERALEHDVVGRLVVAEPEPVEMKEFLRLLEPSLGRPVRLLPLPLAPKLALVRLLETVGLRPPLSSENLLALRRMRFVPPSGELRSLGMPIRSARESLATGTMHGTRAFQPSGGNSEDSSSSIRSAANSAQRSPEKVDSTRR